MLCESKKEIKKRIRINNRKLKELEKEYLLSFRPNGYPGGTSWGGR